MTKDIFGVKKTIVKQSKRIKHKKQNEKKNVEEGRKKNQVKNQASRKNQVNLNTIR